MQLAAHLDGLHPKQEGQGGGQLTRRLELPAKMGLDDVGMGEHLIRRPGEKLLAEVHLSDAIAPARSMAVSCGLATRSCSRSEKGLCRPAGSDACPGRL